MSTAQGISLQARRTREAWTFLIPMIGVLLFVAAWPLLRTIWLSFFTAPLDDIYSRTFVGFRNYLEFTEDGVYGVLADSLWWRAVYNTLKFSFISVSLELVLGMIFALVLHVSFPFRGLVRAAVLIPWAIPTVVSARMWSWMLHDQLGIVNDLFLRLGFIDAPVAWIASSDTALWTIIMVDVWKTTPFMALLLLAAMQTLPKDIYESAYIDGVPPWKIFFRVTLPLIYPAIVVAVIFRSLDALRVFDLVYVLTPNNEATITMSVMARQELVDFSKAGYGSAVSTLLFVTLGVLIVLFIRFSRLDLGKK